MSYHHSITVLVWRSFRKGGGTFEPQEVRVQQCDGPDCESEARIDSDEYFFDWTVVSVEPTSTHADLCSHACFLAWAVAVPAWERHPRCSVCGDLLLGTDPERHYSTGREFKGYDHEAVS